MKRKLLGWGTCADRRGACSLIGWGAGAGGGGSFSLPGWGVGADEMGSCSVLGWGANGGGGGACSLLLWGQLEVDGEIEMKNLFSFGKWINLLNIDGKQISKRVEISNLV